MPAFSMEDAEKVAVLYMDRHGLRLEKSQPDATTIIYHGGGRIKGIEVRSMIHIDSLRQFTSARVAPTPRCIPALVSESESNKLAWAVHQLNSNRVFNYWELQLDADSRTPWLVCRSTCPWPIALESMDTIWQACHINMPQDIGTMRVAMGLPESVPPAADADADDDDDCGASEDTLVPDAMPVSTQ